MFFILPVLAVLLTGILAVLLTNKYRRINSKYLRKLPQKDPNIFFGNLLDFFGSTDEFLKTLCNYINTYGPIVRVYDGPFSEAVLITDEKFIEYILGSTNIIDKSNQYNLLHKWLGTGLLTSSGSKWKSRRKILTPSFHFSILENFVDIFDRQSYVFIKQLEREAEKSFDIYPYVSRCTLDIICEAAMGTLINSQVQGSFEYTSAVKSMCAIIINRTFSVLSPSLYPFTMNHYTEKKVLKVLHSHTDEVINRRIEEVKFQGSQDSEKSNKDLGIKKRLAFLDLLLESTVEGQLLSRRDIREEVDTFMFEGHDTTSSAITFALYSLAMNPKVQDKAFKEQKSIFGNLLKEVKPEVADLQKMKYMELVIKECLRLYPSVPMIARKLPEDLEWEGTIYPKGLNIIIFTFACHRSAKYFSDPLKFIPERFENSDGKNPYRYIPFSAGPRNCIGQKFAMLEMKSTISKVLRNFELLPATPQQELRLAPEIILVSKNGVRLRLKKRI